MTFLYLLFCWIYFLSGVSQGRRGAFYNYTEPRTEAQFRGFKTLWKPYTRTFTVRLSRTSSSNIQTTFRTTFVTIDGQRTPAFLNDYYDDWPLETGQKQPQILKEARKSVVNTRKFNFITQKYKLVQVQLPPTSHDPPDITTAKTTEASVVEPSTLSEITETPTKPKGTPAEPASTEPPTEPTGREIPTEPEGTKPPTDPIFTEPPTESTKAEPPTEPTGMEIPTEPEGTKPPTDPIFTEPPTESTEAEPPTEPTGMEIPTKPVSTEPPMEPAGTEPSAEPIVTEPPNEPIGTEPPTEPAGTESSTDTVVTKTPKIGAYCYVCGLDEPGIQFPTCYNLFDNPIGSSGRRHKKRTRKHCIEGTTQQKDKPHRWYGKLYRGGCFKRFTDVGAVYNERGCRTKKPYVGASYASKRFAKLEKLLYDVDNGCVFTPHAQLTPFSRAISLYVRYHVCVCKGKYCNRATSLPSTYSVTTYILLTMLIIRINIYSN